MEAAKLHLKERNFKVTDPHKFFFSVVPEGGTVGRNPILAGHNYYAASCIMKCMNSGVFFHEDFNGANRFLCFCSSKSLK